MVYKKVVRAPSFIATAFLLVTTNPRPPITAARSRRRLGSREPARRSTRVVSRVYPSIQQLSRRILELQMPPSAKHRADLFSLRSRLLRRRLLRRWILHPRQ